MPLVTKFQIAGTLHRFLIVVQWLCRMSVVRLKLLYQFKKVMRASLVESNQSLPSFDLLKTASLALGTAVSSNYSLEVSARTRRLRLLLAKLKQLPLRKPYVVNTYAGRVAYAAALARCLEVICCQTVDPKTVAHFPDSDSLVRCLIRWLESKQIDNRMAYLPPRPSVAPRALADSAVSTARIRRLQNEIHAEEEKKAEELKAFELRCLLLSLEWELIAVPTALLQAAKMK